MIWAVSSAFVAGSIRHGDNGKCHCELAAALARRACQNAVCALKQCMYCTSVTWNFGRPFSSLAGDSFQSETTQQLWPSRRILSPRKQKNYLSLANCIISKRPPSSFNAANGQGEIMIPKCGQTKMMWAREGQKKKKKIQCIGRRSNLIKLVHLTAWHLSERSREIPSLNLAHPGLSSPFRHHIM